MKELAKSGAIDADLATAFDASPNPYTLLTPDLRFAGMNRAYLDAVGARREDLIGRPMLEVFTSDGDEADENQRQLRTSFEKVLATGEADHLALIRYAMPVVDPETGERRMNERFWSATHTPIRDERGVIAYILQHTNDVTELVTLRRRVAEGAAADDSLLGSVGGDVIRRAEHVQEDNRRLESERNRLADLFAQAPGFMAVLRGPNHVFDLANEAYVRLIGLGRPLVGLAVRDALPELIDQGFFELLDHVYRTGERFEGRSTRVALRRHGDGLLSDHWLDFVYQPVRGDQGQVVGIFVQGHDVTDSVRAAERQKLMIDELNHRVKNTLATVQSIAVQTARSESDPARFAETFQARLLSLSHTHNLLTQSHWEGAPLRDVLAHETEAHGATRIVLNGPHVPLTPAMAVSLGMIAHELATNAAKYGALSTPDGRVFVDWSLRDQAAPMLDIVWREQGGPEVRSPERRGFGSRLIERNVRHDLAGEVKLGYATSGFTAEISIPLSRDGEA